MNKKIVALVLACVLIFSTVVGGTLAYLVSKSNTVTNTFTFGNVNISLDETGATGETDKTKSFALIPGQSYLKDPVVKVAANSEDCYVFVEVKETIAADKTFADYVTYNVDAGNEKTWTALDGQPGVYYVKYEKTGSEKSYYVLEGDTTYTNGVVTCPGTLTSETIAELGGNNPTLTFTAYAIQDEGFTTATEAWNAMNTQLNS